MIWLFGMENYIPTHRHILCCICGCNMQQDIQFIHQKNGVLQLKADFVSDFICVLLIHALITNINNVYS